MMLRQMRHEDDEDSEAESSSPEGRSISKAVENGVGGKDRGDLYKV